MSDAPARERAPGDAVAARIERYTSLRGALRAVHPSTRFQESDQLDEAFREVRGWLRQAAAGSGDPVDGGAGAWLAKIDFGLDAIGGEIIGRLRGIPLAQLRATLPQLCQSHPDEVAALLDLWLSEPERALEWHDLVDYVVTLLACDVVEGRRRLARDPVRVTALLEQTCEAAAVEAGEAAHELARDFDAAREELERGDPVQPIVARIRERKREGLRLLLAPDVLRAIVRYNVVVGRRLEELDDVDRTLGSLELRDVRPRPPADSPAAPAAPTEATASTEAIASTEAPAPQPAPAPAASDSAFECAPLLALVRALQDRLARRPAPAGACGELAARLELEKLSRFEERSLRGGGADADPTLELAATLLLLGRRAADEAPALAGLGIDCERLRSLHLPELTQRLSECIRALVDGDAYDDARRIADLRTRMMAAWDEAPSGWQLERAPAPAPPVAAARAPRTPVVRPAEAAAPAQRATSRRPVLRALALAGLLLAVVGAGALRWWARGNADVRIYGNAELAAISPHLLSGYRNGLGYGPMFIGTLRSEFARLPHERRVEATTRAARALEGEGVREIFLFDETRRLQAHWAAGRLDYPSATP